MFRFYIDEDDLGTATQLLDRNNIPYDLDGGNRVMVKSEWANEAAEIWDDNGIEYDEI